MRLFVFLTIFCCCHALSVAAGEAPKAAADKPLSNEERPADWLRATERLRWLPRPGEIHNAGVLANIGDLVETTSAEKAAIVDALKAYDAALAKKAEQWENDMKALRAEHQAKVVAALPEARREAAKKALEYSQAQWTLPLDFDAKIRTGIVEKFDQAKVPGISPDEASKVRREVRDWIKVERQKEAERNTEVIKNLKAMFDPAEVERLDKFDKNREVPAQQKPKK